MTRTCLTCGGLRKRLVRDHCHIHDMERGILCDRCNSLVGQIDARLRPSSDALSVGVSLNDLLMHIARCELCQPISASDLNGTRKPYVRRKGASVAIIARIEPALLNLERAAEFLGGVETSTLEKWRQEGRGPAWKLMGRSVKYPLSGLREYVASLPDGKIKAEAAA